MKRKSKNDALSETDDGSEGTPGCADSPIFMSPFEGMLRSRGVKNFSKRQRTTASAAASEDLSNNANMLHGGFDSTDSKTSDCDLFILTVNGPDRGSVLFSSRPIIMTLPHRIWEQNGDSELTRGLQITAPITEEDTGNECAPVDCRIAGNKLSDTTVTSQRLITDSACCSAETPSFLPPWLLALSLWPRSSPRDYEVRFVTQPGAPPLPTQFIECEGTQPSICWVVAALFDHKTDTILRLGCQVEIVLENNTKYSTDKIPISVPASSGYYFFKDVSYASRKSGKWMLSLSARTMSGISCKIVHTSSCHTMDVRLLNDRQEDLEHIWPKRTPEFLFATQQRWSHRVPPENIFPCHLLFYCKSHHEFIMNQDHNVSTYSVFKTADCLPLDHFILSQETARNALMSLIQGRYATSQAQYSIGRRAYIKFGAEGFAIFKSHLCYLAPNGNHSQLLQHFICFKTRRSGTRVLYFNQSPPWLRKSGMPLRGINIEHVVRVCSLRLHLKSCEHEVSLWQTARHDNDELRFRRWYHEDCLIVGRTAVVFKSLRPDL